MRRERSPRLSLLVPAILGTVLCVGASEARARTAMPMAQAPATSSDTAATLRSRIGPPSAETIAEYRGAGAASARPHDLTDEERALVEQAIAALPPAHRHVLEQRLERLSFIDAPASTGTALTRAFDGPDGRSRFEITIRSDVLEMTLTDFLTRKERRLFTDDGTGLEVHVHAGPAPALPYLLIHEAAHVVDGAFGISADVRPFATLWTDYRELAEPYASGPIGRSVYRRGPPMPLSRSIELYRTMAASPFVSLYSTASAGEDFAELSAWSTLSGSGIPLQIEVRDATGRQVLMVAPLASGAVQARMATVEALLARPGGGPAADAADR